MLYYNMDDIFEEWKNNRFVIAGSDLHEHKGHHLIIMTDFSYWSSHADDCIAWCLKNNCKVEGMTILIPSDTLLTAFMLKWK